MKKIISTAALICITLLLLLETLGLAWLTDNNMSSVIDITSNVRKSYFESGDGTKDIVYDDDNNIIAGPFEIKRPVQLYYFAWLQYLGYFNIDNNNDGEIDTVYFRLSDDLDMDYTDPVTKEKYSYVLPPIGTMENPFLGNFDGCGYTITDLTVKNVHTSLSDPPNGVSQDEFGGVDIIGFFGVIGELKEGDYDYSSKANEVKNVILENLTIKTETANALIGLVAGYVNGRVDCVGVVGSTVDIGAGTLPLSYTDNISDFSLIGYCTPEYMDSVYLMDVMLTDPDLDSYTVVPASGEGSSQGWGGSVAMKDICTWLLHLKNNNSTSTSFVTKRTEKVFLDGTREQISRPSTATKKVKYIENFGSFIFDTMSGDYNFMSGGTSVTEYVFERVDGATQVYVISDGTNYVGLNGTSITNVKDPGDAATWYCKEESDGEYSLYTDIGNNVYYLTVSSNSLSLTDGSSPAEPPTFTGIDGDLSYDSRKIVYDGGKWQTQSTTNSNTYYISFDNNYLSLNSSKNGLTNISGSEEATKWTLSTTSGSTTIYTTVTGSNGSTTTYYLRRNSSSLQITTSSGQATRWTVNNGRISYKSGNTTYYLRYNNGTWSLNNNQNNATTVTFTRFTVVPAKLGDGGFADYNVKCYVNEYIENLHENYYYDSNGNKIVTSNTNNIGITYFPLSSAVDTETNSYEAASNNTGYIISTNWGDIERGEENSRGIVRISRYDRENNLNNYNAPYTITYKSGGVTQIVDADNGTEGLGLQKFASCYSQYLESVGVNEENETTADDDCYGLHFMSASVTMSNIATIDAYLNGDLYEDYQMPTNCIDFKLYEQGFINFFAGSYYKAENPPNNSFFSIYEIIRDGNEITEIREISRIFAILDENDNIVREKGKENNYLYTYTVYTEDEKGNIIKTEVGAENIPTGEDLPLNERYQEIFDCAWICDSENSLGSGWHQDSAYYFEVPVNAGEYAIGSTYDRTGAYLIYLDLAANAQLVERTKEYEVITGVQTSATLPYGVEVLEQAGENEKYNTAEIDSQNSAFVSIGGQASGEITFEKNGNAVEISTDDNTSAQYIGNGTILREKGGEEITIPIDSTTVVRRTTYRDLNINTGVYTVTVITETEVTKNGQSKSTWLKEVTKTVYDENGNPTTTVTKKESDTILLPDNEDATSSPESQQGADFLGLAFTHVQTNDFVITYEYVPAQLDENNAVISPATYLIKVDNKSGRDVKIKAKLTGEGAASGLNFVITDGEGNVITDSEGNEIGNLEKTTDEQIVTVVSQATTQE